jgi:Tfp pilus assembly ATPase PilU
MYSIDDLLSLVATEQAEELRLHAGNPPVLVVQSEHHAVEGPALTGENTEQLLRSVANSRQIRQFREHRMGDFLYTFQESLRFRVHATLEDENVGLDLQRQDF